jgi:hypothetical protein
VSQLSPERRLVVWQRPKAYAHRDVNTALSWRQIIPANVWSPPGTLATLWDLPSCGGDRTGMIRLLHEPRLWLLDLWLVLDPLSRPRELPLAARPTPSEAGRDTDPGRRKRFLGV